MCNRLDHSGVPDFSERSVLGSVSIRRLDPAVSASNVESAKVNVFLLRYSSSSVPFHGQVPYQASGAATNVETRRGRPIPGLAD
jgi:hypothetical protein